MTARPIGVEVSCDGPTEQARTARLLQISPEQITRYSAETILDWLDARREQRITRIRAACQVLREESARRQRAYSRLAAPAAARPRPVTHRGPAG